MSQIILYARIGKNGNKKSQKGTNMLPMGDTEIIVLQIYSRKI